MTHLVRIVIASLMLTACADGDPTAGSREQLAGWTEGRTFSANIRLSPGKGPLVPQTITVGDANATRVESLIDAVCSAEIGSRFSPQNATPWPTKVRPKCGATGARVQQLDLCRAHRYLLFAKAVTATEIYRQSESDVTIRTRPSEPIPDDPFASRTPEVVLPVPSASAAASLALVAASYFQAAGFAGADCLELTCPVGSLSATVPASRGPTGDGWSTERVTLAFVVASATAEATHMIGEAADLARNRLDAAAQQRLARDRDAPRATRALWRARHDSRLEVANLLAGVPAGLFEPDDGTAGSAVLDVADLAPESDVGRRAEELVRSLRVDPRLSESELYDAVRDALAEDLPQAFGPGAMATDPVAYLQTIGVDSRELRQAARRIVQESTVTGRPILTIDPAVPGGRPRVAGTAPTAAPADPAFLFARTAGAGRFADVDVTAPDTHAPSRRYAERGVLNTQDYLAQIVERALQRSDVRADPAASTLLDQARLLARETVGMRVQVAVGATTFTCPPFPFPCERPPFGGDDLSAVRIRLYGARGDASQYQIWRGEEGLQCAQTGQIEGQPCDPTAYHVPVPAEQRTDGALSGLGALYLEWTITPPAPDVPGASLSDGDRLYIVAASTTASGEAGSATDSPTLPTAPIAGFVVSAGSASSPSSPWTRISELVAGTDVTNVFGGVLLADPAVVTRALNSCAGVPNDVRIPLEDELTEATEGRDDIESSWAHYVRIARQAADEADALGEELIRQGLEGDVRAESARDELESLCGGVINVGSLAGPPPATCTCPGAEAECTCPDTDMDGLPDPGCTFAAGVPSCTRCAGGLCLPRGITGLLSDSPDLDSVRRCLGEDGGLVNAALGNTPLCSWRYTGEDGVTLPPCVCPDGHAECPGRRPLEFPQCPAPAGSSTACSEVFPPLPAGFSVSAPSQVIGLTVGAGAFATPASCADLARVRNRVAGDPSLFSRVLSQELLDLPVMRAVAEPIAYREDHLRFATVSRNGRAWLSTGSLRNGPTAATTDRPLCGPLVDGDLYIELGCDRPPTDFGFSGRSILCGIGSCDTFPARDITALRVRHALTALTALSGASAGGPGGEEDFFSRASGSMVAEPEQLPDWLRTLPEVCGVADPDCLDGTIQTWVDRDLTFRTIVLTRFPLGLPPEYAGYLALSGRPDPADDLGWLPSGRSREVRLFTADVGDAALAAVWEPGGPIDDALSQFHNGANERFVSLPGVHSGIPTGDMFDALEIACLAQQDFVGACGGVLTELPTVDGVEDFPRLQRMLGCVADEFDQTINRLGLTDAPRALVEDLHTGAVSPTFPRYRGEYGQTVAELRAALEGIVAANHTVASNIREFGGDLRIAESDIAIINAGEEVLAVQLTAQVSGQVARCADATLDAENLFSFGAKAAVTCLDAVVQIGTAIEINHLQSSIADINITQTLTRLSMLFATRMDALSEAIRHLSESYANVNRLLAKLDQQRSAARRAAARVLMLDRDDTGREHAVNHVLRGRINTTRHRYDNARIRAIRYAFLARKAVEQRLGVDLSEMHEAMTLVDPPATWADTLCSRSGINYERLRNVDLQVDAYDDGYIGDYVRQLEDFVESYRIDYPFQDGSDVAVISVRDELLGVRETCDAPGWNLFLQSVSPAIPTADTPWPWQPTSAGPGLGATLIPDSSNSPFRTEDSSPPSAEMRGDATRRLQGGAAFELRAPRVVIPPGPDEPGRVDHAAWQQSATLGPGTYLVSWYEGVTLDDPEPLPPSADSETANQHCRDLFPAHPPRVLVLASSSAPSATVAVAPMAYIVPTEGVDRWLDACRWRRTFSRVTVSTDAAVPVSIGFTLEIGNTAVAWSSPQLESLTPAEAELSSTGPKPFFPTDDDLRYAVGLCEDTNGSYFRGGRYWRTGCEYLCPDGLGTSCSSTSMPNRALQRCFRETDLTISLDDIERGELLPSGNLALGNFNYRFDTIAVNLVGTGVQDCSRAATPTECYANAFVPFSLRHAPPFRIRNHRGQVVHAPLFIGHIEHARSLAAERYITNPISSADRALLADYQRRELRGRPLEGHFRLRIWDAPGLDWNRVEDVQLILGYRYWTRFE